jgi:two-component system, OmpR family, phosphate regulon response regulator PhoB
VSFKLPQQQQKEFKVEDAVLTKPLIKARATLSLGGLVLNDETCRVAAHGKEIALNPTEYRILYFFMAHPETVHSRSELLARVWGSNIVVGIRTVDVHIRRLRVAMAASRTSHLVQTVRGRGYRFSLDDSANDLIKGAENGKK